MVVIAIHKKQSYKVIQSLYETDSLDRNNKKMIGDDMVISYKVDTNFIKTLVKSISHNHVVIEWE